MKFITPVILIFCLVYQINAQKSEPVLSNLNATVDSPIYTTYAAALERSEFTLDEGYHFLFYDSSRGLDFITDTGGDICLAFKRGAEYIYELENLAKPPIITVNYPDMVRYHYFPFSEVRVDATFLTYSSHEVILDLNLTNVSKKPQSFQIIPFLQNHYRTFNQIVFHPDNNAITFTHEELPDRWVLNHDVPYVNPVRDVFQTSFKPDRQTSYRSYKWGNISIPQEINIMKKPVYVVWGKISKADGERYRSDKVAPEVMVSLSSQPGKILTSTAPRWGSADPNISSYGFYGIELGNFGELQPGDVYTLRFLSRETGQIAVVTDTVKDTEKKPMIRHDLILGNSNLPQPPGNLDKDIWGSGTEIRLFWKRPQEEYTYNVYRRNYRESGSYELLLEKTDRNFFTDKNIQGDQIFGYLVVSVAEDGQLSMPSVEINNIAGSDFITDIRYPNQITNNISDLSRVIAMPSTIHLAPSEHKHLRLIRAVSRLDKNEDELIRESEKLLTIDMNPFQQQNEELFSDIPYIDFQDPNKALLYWSAFSLMRQVMLPPEGKCNFNYYVFSREPTWGWGHGGQVFHESLTMMAYAHMDATSAMNSQRVYLERQYPEGYINYRTGSFLDETIPYNDQLTSSAPWYAWQNWEVYRITGDKKFLEEMYESSKKFYNYYVSNRDSDNDGLCEWGAHAVLESVRDARVAVWDEVGWPSNFEGIDLNSMLVKEAKSLANMARELGKDKEADKWDKDAADRSAKINTTMWDEETGFYYHVDKQDNDFTFKNPNDLKREEIIGFLPLWAGIASEEQAKKLVTTLTDPEKFWRKYGVPSLSASDSYYNPKGYWNGPVWVEWDFLIVHGLLQYGYSDLARELVDRVAANMIAQLQKDHQFWEFYSPDDQWAGYHKQYIWAGIINRMLMDVYSQQYR